MDFHRTMKGNETLSVDNDMVPLNDGVYYSEYPTTNMSILLENVIQVHQQYSSKIAVYGIILTIFSSVLNTLLLVAIWSSKKLRNQATYQSFSTICFVNLVSCSFVNPIAVYYEISDTWELGQFICKGWITLDLLIPFVGIMVLCESTIDRFILVFFPSFYVRTIGRLSYLSPFILPWILSSIILLPIIHTGSSENTDIPGYCIFAMDGLAPILIPVISFFSPSILLIISMILTLMGTYKKNEAELEAHRRSLTWRSHDTNANVPENEDEYEKVSLFMLYVSNALFIMLWFPHQFVSLLLSFCTSCLPPYEVIIGFTWLGTTSMFIVPFVWLWDSNIRRRFAELRNCLQTKHQTIDEEEGTEVQLMDLDNVS